MHRPVMMLVIALAAPGCGDDSGNGAGEPVLTYAIDQDGGQHSISGEVSLPGGVPDGAGIQVQVHSDATIIIGGIGTTDDTGSFAYRLTGLADGQFRIRFRIDMDANDQVGDSGDLDGYYDGSVEAPIWDRNDATAITVAGGSVADADFGLGPVP